ncbi:MAG: hypothetical protein HYR76_01460 [Ignavibacteria bacterium]|nr:hypothetical protein [Ignavibacteria bacterium]MBI3766425.1 hypothetical protein [Ignavibacteriales bacterium]
MYRLLLILCTLFVLEMPALAQEDEEEPLPPRRHTQAKIGGAGGFTQNLLFLDLDPINEVLRNSNAAEFEKGPMLLVGGQGYGYILVIPNLRIGGIGGSGTIKSKSLDLSTKTRRDVELSVGFGGVTIDYVIPVIPRLDVACGVLLGGGGTTIKMTRDQGAPKVWSDLWSGFGDVVGSTNEYSRTLSGSFFVYQPSVNVEYAVLRWLGLRAGVSYLGMAGNNWKLDDKYELVGVPDRVSGKGFMFNGGIFLGTFIF